jgi:hypothetical protein
MMCRLLRTTGLAIALGFGLWVPAAAQACPMCKLAHEEGENGEANTRPQAYMYSILFMLGMPPTILGAFGYSFYRMSKSAGSVEPGATVDPEA